MQEEPRLSVRGRIWSIFKGSALWRALKRVGFLRKGFYLVMELDETVRGPREASLIATDAIFIDNIDPWKYETDAREHERFSLQTALLDEFRAGELFESGLEIGCAEGFFTEVIAKRCKSLLVLDLSPTALARAQARRPWPSSVRFQSFDLRDAAIPACFDLIVVAGVLEYFTKRKTFINVRSKLSDALQPGGYLLVESTRKSPVVEGAWFGKAMIRGRWINDFIAKDPSLNTVSEVLTEKFAITLLQKTERGGAQ
jgi:SAM-dependent methyltransferase